MPYSSVNAVERREFAPGEVSRPLCSVEERSGVMLIGALELLVLTLLEDEPLCGVQLLREVQRVQRGSPRPLAFRPAHLHPALTDLRNAGLLEVSWRPAPSGEALRVYYGLSAEGLTALYGAYFRARAS